MKIVVGVPPLAHVSLANDEIAALQQIGYACYPVQYGRNNISGSAFSKLLATVQIGWRLIRQLYTIKPQLLYLNSRFEIVGSSRDFVTMLLIKLFYYRKLAVVIKSHGSEADTIHTAGQAFRKYILGFLISQVDGWIFLSEDEKQLLSNQFPAMRGRLFVAPNIIDPSRCIRNNHFDADYSLPAHKFKILYVGRVVREKGVFDIVDAIRDFENKEDTAVIIVGNGPDLIALQQHVKEKGLEKYVHFMGFLPDHECDHFYANADLLLFPTYAAEGFAMALFKSVAVGLPIITTKVRAALDHLKEPDNVLWVRSKNPADIAAAVNNLMSNKMLMQSMGKNNLALGKQFSGMAVAQKMNLIFDQSLKNAGSK